MRRISNRNVQLVASTTPADDRGAMMADRIVTGSVALAPKVELAASSVLPIGVRGAVKAHKAGKVGDS